MPRGKRRPVEPTDDWSRLAELVAFPEQRAYEELRPVVLFGRPVEQRAEETHTPPRTLYRRAARFVATGMASLFAPPKVAKHRRLPARIRAAIRTLKAEHPGFHAHEIADICAIRFGQRPSPHTVKRILAEDPPVPVARRRFPPYRDIPDPAEARLAVVRLHSEGWAAKSIAAYLECSRQQVYLTLRRWIAEGVAGLDSRASAPRRPATRVTPRAIATVKELQENPRLGEFRAAATLRQQGLGSGAMVRRSSSSTGRRRLPGIASPTSPASGGAKLSPCIDSSRPRSAPHPWPFLLDDAQWRKAWRTSGYAPQPPGRVTAARLSLFPHGLPDVSLA